MLGMNNITSFPVHVGVHWDGFVVWLWKMTLFCVTISVMHVRVCSVFIGVSDREESHGNIRKLKEKKRNDDDLKNYKEWLKRASKSTCYSCTYLSDSL